MILFILAITLWALRPTVPELVVQIPLKGSLLLTRRVGFLIAKDTAFDSTRHSIVEFWAWHGTEQWSVRLPKVNLEGWRTPPSALSPWRGRAFSLDPTGRIAAVAYADGPRVRVVSWRNGRRLGEVALPVTPDGPLTGRDRFDIQALHDGRVLLWLSATATSPVWVIKGRRIEATGRHASRLLPDRRAIYSRTFSSDGKALLGYYQTAKFHGRVEYAQLEQSGSAVILRASRLLDHFDDPVLFDGAVVAGDGEIYGTYGRVSAHDDWRLARETPPTPWCAVQYYRKSARVIVPATGKSWGMPRPAERWSTGLSPDGRYAVLFDRRARTLPVPAATPDAVREALSLVCTPRRVQLYARPGTRLASLTLPGDRYAAETASLAPDGRTLLVRATETTAGRETLFLYRIPSHLLKTP